MDLADVIVALDVDGVLLDPTRGGRGWWTNDLREQLGIDRETIQRVFFARPEWDDITHGRMPLPEGLAICLNEAGINVPADDVIRCWFEADWHPNDAVVAAAKAWSEDGARIVLATTQEHARAAFLVSRFAALFPLERSLHSAGLGVSKPDPRYFALATAMIQPARRDSVVFVDDARSNVEAARVHGWRAVHFVGQPNWRAEVEVELDAASRRRGA